MNAAEVTAIEVLVEYFQAIGLGFGDLLILIVLVGAFWLINKGKLKLGSNGYVTEKEFRTDMIELKEDLKAIRSRTQDLDVKVGKLETAVEQFRR